MSSSSNCNTLRRRLLLAAALTPLAAMANVLPQLPALSGVRWQRWGSGELRRFGFRVYRATLWAGSDDPQQPPYALELEYALSISGERLAATSVDEMRHIGVGDAVLRARWGEELRRLFPDVRAGERIVGMHLPEGAVFYHQAESRTRLLGRIDDPAFARAFFAIWLNSKSSAPELRAILLRRAES